MVTRISVTLLLTALSEGSSPAELGALQEADIAKWIKRVKDLKLPTK